MNIRAATYLVIFLHAEDEDHAMYLLSEILGQTTVVSTEEENLLFELAPFKIPIKEKRITLALGRPLTPEQINDVAGLVITSMITGFLIRGQIDLGGSVINNLAPLGKSPL
jgi:hypothetical protein